MSKTKKKVEKKAFTIYPSRELLVRLKEDAEVNHRSANAQIVFIIEEHLKNITRGEK